MSIRNATYHDAPIIKSFLTALGFNTRTSILISQIENEFDNDDHQVFVYEIRKEVVGFITAHYIPHLTFEGGVMFITYLASDEFINDPGITIAMEQYVSDIARKRKCYQIMAGCAFNSQFYLQQGYHKSTEFFVKKMAV
jgi:N-acetylglutamate synthase-like GNAT family acetyltransferase